MSVNVRNERPPVSPADPADNPSRHSTLQPPAGRADGAASARELRRLFWLGNVTAWILALIAARMLWH